MVTWKPLLSTNQIHNNLTSWKHVAAAIDFTLNILFSLNEFSLGVPIFPWSILFTLNILQDIRDIIFHIFLNGILDNSISIYYPQYLIWWFIVDQQVYYLYFGYTILGIFCWTVAVEMTIAAAAPTDIIAIGRTKK